jgi:hypothetical protein
MKQILLLTIFICLLGFIGKAQEHLPAIEDYSAFAKTKTLIVLDDNPMSEYNFRIKDVIKNNWTITEYGFISNKEFENKRFDPKYSFIINSIVTFNKDKTKARYNFLSLVMGSKEKK